MQNQVFEQFMCPFGPGFEKVYVPILAPNFQKFMCPCFARFQAKPGLRMVKHGFSEKKAVQKWGQNRNPCLLRSFRDHVLFFSETEARERKSFSETEARERKSL